MVGEARFYRLGTKLRDEGIQRADDHADEEWKDAAYVIGLDLALNSPDGWTSDEIMARLDEEGYSTREGRALGAVVRRVTRAVPCDVIGNEASCRPERHRGTVRRWRAIAFRDGVCPKCHRSFSP